MCVCVCARACVSVRVCVCVCMYIYIYIQEYIYICMYVCICICICIYTYTRRIYHLRDQGCTRIQTHIDTYTLYIRCVSQESQECLLNVCPYENSPKKHCASRSIDICRVCKFESSLCVYI